MLCNYGALRAAGGRLMAHLVDPVPGALAAFEDELVRLGQFVAACNSIADMHHDCPPWLFVVMRHHSALEEAFTALCTAYASSPVRERDEGGPLP